jgi:hypothetical protein
MSMDNFQEIIGKTLKEIYLEPFAIADKYDKTEIFDDFISLESGHIVLLTEENETFIIGALHSTKLATNYFGLVRRADLDGCRFECTESAALFDSFFNKKVVGLDLFWNKEDWTDYNYNEYYIESASLKFDNKTSLTVFCGEYEETNGSFIFLSGRSSLILFLRKELFIKYNLDKVSHVEMV